ncbi:NADPH:quinone reductase [Ruegeria sp. PrR005]|uniref:NADPH:quinone reductase n=1 Tax=Ruegeria sp. PrR005 TaxID=2706882 RepID=A0A6B2NXB3_9RHOB|nr:NADPH:quinone reductase [Ruegeria sp. PrR005]NDW48098.1 NADPH:quinone reductase [Ruegeria sp. PrR005]
MKAITYRSFGPAAEVLTLEEMEPPRPGAGEVLVDVALSGVNPSDVKARAGARAGVTELPYPVIVPHSDGSGVISAVGDGVDPARIGQRVWLWNGQWRRAMGTCAEQIALPSAQAVPLPQGVSLETGAVLGIPGLTASHVVFSGGPVAGQTVLVHGGAGTVGYLAVQLAKWGGARVIATAGGGAADRVRDAGADAVLDYAEPDLAAAILDANKGQPVDRIVEVEFGVNVATDAAVIAENGRINAYGSAKAMAPELPFYPLMFKAVTLEMALVYLLTPPQRAAAIDQLHAALSAGALRIPVQQTYALGESAAAHEAVETGGRHGAILVETAT